MVKGQTSKLRIEDCVARRGLLSSGMRMELRKSSGVVWGVRVEVVVERPKSVVQICEGISGTVAGGGGMECTLSIWECRESRCCESVVIRQCLLATRERSTASWTSSRF